MPVGSGVVEHPIDRVAEALVRSLVSLEPLVDRRAEADVLATHTQYVHSSRRLVFRPPIATVPSIDATPRMGGDYRLAMHGSEDDSGRR